MRKICYVVTISTTIKAFFIKQLQYLSENGFDVTVICSPDDTLQDMLGERVRYVPMDIPRGISVRHSFSAIRRLYCFFKQEKFDLIQYSTPNAAFYAAIAAKLVGCKIRNYHLMGFRYLGAKGIGRVILKAIEKITCNNSTSIECVSRSNLELGIKEKLFTREKVTVVWNGSTGGIDLERFDYSKRETWRKDLRNKLGYKDSDFVYGFVGRITRDKGVNELLEAYLKLEDDSKLLFVGSMEGTESLNKNLLDCARENKNIMFHVAVKDVERFYAAIDVLILPSYREGFGNVVIEAGAVGTPAIVSNIPGPIDAIRSDETALVVAAKDVLALGAAMKNIRQRDYITMGKNAVQFAEEKFDTKILCGKILEQKRKLMRI